MPETQADYEHEESRPTSVSSEQQYQAALHKLKQAEDSDYTDREALQQAHHLLRAALRKSKEVRYLLTMAELMFLVDEEVQCHQYLNEILALEPEHNQALCIQAELELEKLLSPEEVWLEEVEVFDALSHPQSEDEYERYYDVVEEFVRSQVRFLLQQDVSPDLTFDEAALESQFMLFQKISHVQTLVTESLEVLYEVFEINELQGILKPLRQLEERFTNALYYNSVFQIMDTGFTDVKQKSTRLIQKIMSSPHTEAADFEASLNDLLDDCDALADDLDTFSEQVSLQLIEPQYEAVLQQVQQVQDLLDER